MTLVFGQFVDEFNGFATGTVSVEEFKSAIAKNA